MTTIDKYLEQLCRVAPKRAITREDIREMFSLSRLGHTQEAIGLQFGCSSQYVGMILGGKRRLRDIAFLMDETNQREV